LQVLASVLGHWSRKRNHEQIGHQALSVEKPRGHAAGLQSQAELPADGTSEVDHQGADVKLDCRHFTARKLGDGDTAT
jgi:hypothetical protein